MAPEERIPNEMELSRRDFVRVATLGAAVAAGGPSIVSLSGCARPPAADVSKTEAGVREYQLEIGKREAAPDGRPREIFCYNGELIGPLIRAKVGETLRVKVVNKLDVPSSVHWHGMHQPNTWRMDGVANVSAPPIPPGSEFVYEFKATPAGTHWYHSHTGVQYGDGLFGPLIVDEEATPFEYDREEILLFDDWFLKSSEEILADLVKPMPGAGQDGKAMPKPAGKMAMDKSGKPAAAMRGMADIGDVPFESALFNGLGRFDAANTGPLTTFTVNKGEIIRLRLINGSTTYALRFQIDGHRLKVVASDGSPIVPVEVDNLVVHIGERYDVLLTADQEGTAWIRAATLAGDEGRAILRYSDAGDEQPAAEPTGGRGADELRPQNIRSPQQVSLASNPREIKLELGGSMTPYRWTINDQEYPQADPLKLEAGEAIRFVLDNPTGMGHPFHLHGHYFYVLGPRDSLNVIDPPRKDTVNVPPGSSLVLQWVANNPGRWFFHCHIEWHAATGMARVIEIGPIEGASTTAAFISLIASR